MCAIYRDVNVSEILKTSDELYFCLKIIKKRHLLWALKINSLQCKSYQVPLKILLMKSIAFICSFWFLKEKIWQSIFWNSGRGSQDLVMWILSFRRNSDLCLKCVQSKAFKVMKYQGWLGSTPFGRSIQCWPIPEVKILICLTWFVLGVNYHCFISSRRCIYGL